jgi:hypothetical protein
LFLLGFQPRCIFLKRLLANGSEDGLILSEILLQRIESGRNLRG